MHAVHTCKLRKARIRMFVTEDAIALTNHLYLPKNILYRILSSWVLPPRREERRGQRQGLRCFTWFAWKPSSTPNFTILISYNTTHAIANLTKSKAGVSEFVILQPQHNPNSCKFNRLRMKKAILGFILFSSFEELIRGFLFVPQKMFSEVFLT